MIHHQLARLGLAAVIGLSAAGARLVAPPAAAPAPFAAVTWDRALDRAQRVHLNDADADQLERLPGIGPALARRIIAHRLAAGPFRTTEELRRVSGVGPKLYERVQEYVTVE